MRGRTHWNISNIQARDPVLIGICTQTDLEEQRARARRREERRRAKGGGAASAPATSAAPEADAPPAAGETDPG